MAEQSTIPNTTIDEIHPANTPPKALPPTESIPDIKAYVEHIWDTDVAAQKYNLFKTLREDTIQELDGLEKQGRIPPFHMPKITLWRQKSKDVVDLFLQYLTKRANKSSNASKRYRNARREQGKDVFEKPTFNIDPLVSKEQLDIQKKYAIERAARHLSSEVLSFQEAELHRLSFQLCESRQCPHYTEDVSFETEEKEIERLWPEPATIQELESGKVEEASANLTYEEILYPEVAKLTGRRLDGTPDPFARSRMAGEIAENNPSHKPSSSSNLPNQLPGPFHSDYKDDDDDDSDDGRHGGGSKIKGPRRGKGRTKTKNSSTKRGVQKRRVLKRPKRTKEVINLLADPNTPKEKKKQILWGEIRNRSGWVPRDLAGGKIEPKDCKGTKPKNVSVNEYNKKFESVNDSMARWLGYDSALRDELRLEGYTHDRVVQILEEEDSRGKRRENDTVEDQDQEMADA